jgi:hypothetical protein
MLILTHHVRFVSIKPSSVSRNPPIPVSVDDDDEDDGVVTVLPVASK